MTFFIWKTCGQLSLIFDWNFYISVSQLWPSVLDKSKWSKSETKDKPFYFWLTLLDNYAGILMKSSRNRKFLSKSMMLDNASSKNIFYYPRSILYIFVLNSYWYQIVTDIYKKTKRFFWNLSHPEEFPNICNSISW